MLKMPSLAVSAIPYSQNIEYPFIANYQVCEKRGMTGVWFLTEQIRLSLDSLEALKQKREEKGRKAWKFQK